MGRFQALGVLLSLSLRATRSNSPIGRNLQRGGLPRRLRLLAMTVILGAGSLGAHAQIPGGDSKQPIEITADTLEILQEQRKAVFSGNVLAKQGEITMKAARMIVFYKGEAEPGDKKQAEMSAAKGISRLEADGEVFFTSMRETAKSARASYDVDKQTITMNDNVILTRDKNVLKGSQLVYNLANGKSVLSAKGAEGTAGKGRVKGLFVPSKEK